MLNICKNFKRGKVKSKVAHFLTIAKARGISVRVLMNRGAKISEEEAARMTVDEMIDYAVKTRNPLPRTPTTSELMKSKYFTFPGVNRKD